MLVSTTETDPNPTLCLVYTPLWQADIGHLYTSLPQLSTLVRATSILGEQLDDPMRRAQLGQLLEKWLRRERLGAEHADTPPGPLVQQLQRHDGVQAAGSCTAIAVWMACPRGVSVQALGSPLACPSPWFSISSQDSRRRSRRDIWPSSAMPEVSAI